MTGKIQVFRFVKDFESPIQEYIYASIYIYRYLYTYIYLYIYICIHVYSISCIHVRFNYLDCRFIIETRQMLVGRVLYHNM